MLRIRGQSGGKVNAGPPQALRANGDEIRFRRVTPSGEIGNALQDQLMAR
jgi:hypothetical protein